MNVTVEQLVQWLKAPQWDDISENNQEYYYEEYYAPVVREQEQMYEEEGMDPDEFRDEIEDLALEALSEGEAQEYKQYVYALTDIADEFGAAFDAEFDPDLITGKIRVTVGNTRDDAQGMVDLINGFGFVTIMSLDDFMADEEYESYEKMIFDHLHYIGMVPEVYGESSAEQQLYSQLN